MKKLSFITQFKTEFYYHLLVVEKCLEKCLHWWSAVEYLIYLVVKNTLIKLHPHIIKHLKLVASMKILNSCKHPHQEGTVTKKSYGSTHHIVSTWNQTSVEYFYNSLTSTSHDITNTASYSIGIILRSATVVCQIWQVPSKAITSVYWKTLSQLT